MISPESGKDPRKKPSITLADSITRKKNTTVNNTDKTTEKRQSVEFPSFSFKQYRLLSNL